MTTINNNRRQFLQHSALGLATAALPSLLQAKTGRIRSAPTQGFIPDIKIAMTARRGYIPVLEKGSKTHK